MFISILPSLILAYSTGPSGILFLGSSTKKIITAPFLYRDPPRYSITSGDPPKCFPVQAAGPESAIAATTARPFSVLTINTFLYLYQSRRYLTRVFQSGRYKVWTTAYHFSVSAK